MIGSMQLSVVGTAMESFGSARVAGFTVFKIIDTIPKIDSLSKKGKIPTNILGQIKFRAVDFTYPGNNKIKRYLQMCNTN